MRFVVLAVTILLSYSSFCAADETVPLSPGTVTEDAGAGWSNVPPADSVIASDDTRSLTSTQDSLFLKNFGFAIPLGATITAFIITGEAQGSATQSARRVLDVHPVKNGIDPVGDHVLFQFDQDADNIVSHVGGTDSLWGTTWTVAEINSPNFGIVLRKNSSSVGNISIDQFTIVVHFLPAGDRTYINPRAGISTLLRDVYLSELAPTTKHATTHLRLGTESDLISGKDSLARVIFFDTSVYAHDSIPASDSIVACSLTFRIESMDDFGELSIGDSVMVKWAGVTSTWKESQATWINRFNANTWTSAGGDFSTFNSDTIIFLHSSANYTIVSIQSGSRTQVGDSFLIGTDDIKLPIPLVLAAGHHNQTFHGIMLTPTAKASQDTYFDIHSTEEGTFTKVPFFTWIYADPIPPLTINARVLLQGVGNRSGREGSSRSGQP